MTSWENPIGMLIRQVGTALTLGGLLVLASACQIGPGTSPSEPPATAVPSSPPPSSPPIGTGRSELTVVIDDGHGAITTWRLSCDPPGGTHPDPAAACRALDEHGASALPSVPKDRMCTQIYGGAQKATIAGTWRGEQVFARLSLVNGCEIGRWKSLEGLLPPPSA